MEPTSEVLLKSILKNQNFLLDIDGDDDQNVLLETDRYRPPQDILSNSKFLGLCDVNKASTSSSKSLFLKTSKATDGIDSYNVSTFFNEAYFYSKIVSFFQTFGDTSRIIVNTFSTIFILNIFNYY